MTAKVSLFPGTKKIDPKVLLEMAKNWGCDKIAVIGTNKQGEFWIGSSEEDYKEVHWLVYKADNFIRNQID